MQLTLIQMAAKILQNADEFLWFTKTFNFPFGLTRFSY